MDIIAFSGLMSIAVFCSAAAIFTAYDAGHAAAHRQISRQFAHAEDDDAEKWKRLEEAAR